MNRQPLNNWWDEDLDRRVTSPDGLTAVVFCCPTYVKKPTRLRPILIDVSNHEELVRVTVSSGQYFFTSATWNPNVDCYPARIREIALDPVAVIQRLFDFWQAVKK